MRGFRWVETGVKVWGLEDAPRHFLGFVSLIWGGVYSWSVPGGYSIVYSWKSEVLYVGCGESPTELQAKRELEYFVAIGLFRRPSELLCQEQD